jgi:hypothetical protein
MGVRQGIFESLRRMVIEMKDVSYSPNIDTNFVLELAKRGKVHLLSHQVTIEGHSIDLEGVLIPRGVTIDFIGARCSASPSSPVGMVTFRFPE